MLVRGCNVMALAHEAKKGGPYTKQEQDERRKQVYQLHFEQGKSAVKIAEILNVSRNTINEDIRFWYTQLAREIGEDNLSSKMASLIHRLELQRSRLQEKLEKLENFDERLSVERLLFDIESRLMQYVGKILVTSKSVSSSKVEAAQIPEDDIKQLVRELILEDHSPDSEDLFSREELQIEYIRKTKCETRVAEGLFERMLQLGLSLCEDYPRKFSFTLGQKYNLATFANLRGYITIDEFYDTIKERMRIRDHTEQHEREREKRFIEKYGSDKTKWSEDTWQKYVDGTDMPQE